ncbi:MAG: hypothetical protein OEY97_08580 [Nitrospirota bacterium]|nr:hypothetical protein [Nitrospirota bacterium]
MIPFLVVLATVALQIGAALVLKGLADRPQAPMLLLAGGMALVVAFNGLRFVMWGVAHRRYPLSLTYPMSAVFFPLMLLISHQFGEPVAARQVAGTVLITCGVLWMLARVKA